LILLFSIGLAVLTDTQWFVFLLIPLIGLTIYLGQRLSKTATKIDLNDGDHLKINNQEIAYQNVIGYFVNDTGLTQTALCLRLNNEKTIQITCSSVGEQGEKFLEAQNEIIQKIKSKNQHLTELGFQDVYVRQTRVMRPFIIALIPIVVIFNLLAVYLKVSEKLELPWQIFLMNGLVLGLIPIYLKRKKTNANNR